MPRQGGWKEYGRPRTRYQTGAKPQKPGRVLEARRSVYDDPKSNHPRSDQGYHRPGSQNPRK